jgi:hypothetical protein
LGSFGKGRFVAMINAPYGTRRRRFLAVRLRNVHEDPDLAQEVFFRLPRVERHKSSGWKKF